MHMRGRGLHALLKCRSASCCLSSACSPAKGMCIAILRRAWQRGRCPSWWSRRRSGGRRRRAAAPLTLTHLPGGHPHAAQVGVNVQRSLLGTYSPVCPPLHSVVKTWHAAGGGAGMFQWFAHLHKEEEFAWLADTGNVLVPVTGSRWYIFTAHSHETLLRNGRAAWTGVASTCMSSFKRLQYPKAPCDDGVMIPLGRLRAQGEAGAVGPVSTALRYFCILRRTSLQRRRCDPVAQADIAC